MKKHWVVLFAPIFFAVITAQIVAYLAGDTFDGAPNQNAMLVMFLWSCLFPVLALAFPVLTYKFAPHHKGLFCMASFVIVVLSSALNYYFM